MAELRVINLREPILLDDDVARSVADEEWYYMGGRVVAPSDPAFTDVRDLATIVLGPGSYADPDSPFDYRRSTLKRIRNGQPS
ncbi:MAG: hypothetical protein HC869_01200 [Rhodospirillales bacterium]|nr:hypothetical protein [Rhodospirillales bacterium]